MSEDAWHVVLVPDVGHVMCSCAGVNWCSHIDATLIAGERAMVAPEDRETANLAQIAARGRVGATDGWQAHWRGNRRWRGLPPARITSLETSRKTGTPMMSVEGLGNSRRDIITRSKEAGWMVVPRPVTGCLFHVSPDPSRDSSATEAARQRGIPIASYEEWEGMVEALASVMRHEIEARMGITKRLQDGSEKS